MHYKRVIPCLDVDGGRVVKGVGFVDLRDAGDPVELACRYDAAGADELVFLDITATSDQRETVVDLARRTADDVFIPFTIGGGIRSVADAQAVLDAGADKVSVNSAALARPELIDELAATFGAQCVVLAIDAKAGGDGSWEAYVAGGRTPTGRDAVAWAREGTRARRGGDPADQHGPRRHQRRLRPRADRERSPARSAVPVIASGGAGRARAPGARRSRPAPTPCCAPRSSTTASTRSRRSRRIWPRARASPVARRARTSGGRRPQPRRGAEFHGLAAGGQRRAFSMLARLNRPPSGGLFHVSGGRACIAIRGGRDAGLITARTAARRRPLRPTSTDASSCGVLELLAHAIELRRVLRAEPTALHGRLLTMASTTTTHRQTG